MRFSELKGILFAVFARDRIILIDKTTNTVPDDVNLHWWQIRGEKQNVGDMLSVVVFNHMRSRFGLQEKTGKKAHLYAIGSIIDGGYQNAVVWGSGLLRGKERYWWKHLRKLDIRCVRGPRTRKALLENGYACPEIYGDPAILMPLIYPAQSSEKSYPHLVIPHYSCTTEAQYTLSPMTTDWHHFIDEILRAEVVISSSLHGIILAEAYGVPAILLNDHNMNLFKYEDYYYSTGRYEFPIAKSVEEAVTMAPAPLPDLKPLQTALLHSFPKDLWP